MKYFASVVSLIFPPKTLILNRIAFPALNILNLPEFAGHELKKIMSKNIYQYSFFYTVYYLLMYRFEELITKKLNNFRKILSLYSFINNELRVCEL